MAIVFEVEIQEVLSRKVLIEASNRQEAVMRAKELYFDEEVVLDSDDFVGVGFK